MQKDDIQNSTGKASLGFSRRVFLRSAAASAAIAIPVAADGADAGGFSTDEERLNGCIAELRAILARMHPGFDDVGAECIAHETGGVSVVVDARRPVVDWDGDGPYWVEGRQPRYATGRYFIKREWSDADGRFHLIGHYVPGGDFTPNTAVICPSSIIRNLREKRTHG